MEKYKAIFFDWDGTLVETTDLIMRAHNHVRSHFGLDPVEDESFRRGHQSTRELYPQIYGDKAAEAEATLYDFFEKNHLDNFEVYADSLQCLQAIPIRKGLVSNKRHQFLIKEVAHLAWESHFSSIIGAGEAERDKPSSEPLIMAMAIMDQNLKPADILYIGDTETDLRCAKETGCDAALVLRGRDLSELVTEYEPAYVFETLADMTKILEKTYNNQSEKKAC